MTDLCPRDNFRSVSNKIGKFEEILNDKEFANDIERYVYNWAISYAELNNVTRRWDNVVFRKIYLNKCVALCTNLNEDGYVGNTYLRKKVESKEISAKDLVELEPTKLVPDKWEYVIVD